MLWHLKKNCSNRKDFHILGTGKLRVVKDLFDDVYAMFLFCYVVGSYLNCINMLMQFKWVPTTYHAFKKK